MQPQPDKSDNAEFRHILERFQKTHERRRILDGAEHINEPEAPVKIIQLPLWPEPVRGAPNAILRSALFAGIHSKKRQTLGTRTKPQKPLEPVLVAAQNGITVKFAGQQLNQYDADVFFEALHRARLQPLGTECLFRGYDFLRAIGRSDSQLNYEDLDDSLTRLRNAHAVIEWEIAGRFPEFHGGLIDHFYREKGTRLYKISFAIDIKKLFATACWTQLEWEERRALKGHPQAQWLYGYFCSHAQPFPVTVAFLHQKSGSTRGLLKNYRTDLKNALATLEKVLGWKASWENDLITVTRPPTPSQLRHLIANASAKNPKERLNRAQQRPGGGDLFPSHLKSSKIPT